MASGVHVPLTTYLNIVLKGMVEHLQDVNSTGCHASFHAGNLELQEIWMELIQTSQVSGRRSQDRDKQVINSTDRTWRSVIAKQI